MFSSLNVRSLRRRVIPPIVGGLVGALTALGVSYLISPVYESAARVLVTNSDLATPSQQATSLALLQGTGATIADLAVSQDVAVGAASALGTGVGEVAGQVSADFDPASQMMTVKATASNPEQAAAVANAVAAALAVRVSELKLGGSLVAVQPVDTAVPAAGPSAPKTPLNVLLGLLIGLFVGLGVVSARDRFGNRLVEFRQIESDLGLPVIGVVDRLPKRERRDVGRPVGSGVGNAAPGFDATAITAQTLFGSSGALRIVVLSPKVTPATGISAAQIAGSLVGFGTPVMLVTMTSGDDDSRSSHASIANQLPALGALPSVSDALWPVRMTIPEEMTSADWSIFGDYLGALSEAGIAVIVDGGGLLNRPSANQVAELGDLVLLVVEATHTRRYEASHAAALLRAKAGSRVGVLAVGLDPDVSSLPIADSNRPRVVRLPPDGADDESPRVSTTVSQPVVTSGTPN